MSRHEDRQQLAREFGADEIVAERGKEGAGAVREMLDGIGADYVLECVGTEESMKQAMLCARPGGRHRLRRRAARRRAQRPGDVRPQHRHRRRHRPGARTTSRSCCPTCSTAPCTPGEVFDLHLPLDQVADGYRAMDERTAIKTMLTV